MLVTQEEDCRRGFHKAEEESIQIYREQAVITIIAAGGP